METAKVDKKGRITIPKHLRRKAKVKEEAMLK